MALSDSEVHKLMQDIGEINAKLSMVLANYASTERRILELEHKINRHTAMLSLIGACVIFFQDKIRSLLT